MPKRNRLLLIICLLAVTGLVVLQFSWIRHYYKVSLFNVEREVNLAFEDAVRKEFESRCDTIEWLLVEQLMDTSQFVIHSSYNRSTADTQHNIYNASNPNDRTSFSHSDLADSLRQEDTLYRRKIAAHYAHHLRSEDLESHVVFYRTQNLGQFISDRIREYGFDTTRLRPFLAYYLKKRNIDIPFSFHLRPKDSLLNEVEIPDTLAKKNLLLTKSFPTYKWWNQEEQFVRAVFRHPIGHILYQMKWVLVGSLLLIILVAVLIALLLRALFHEKKLLRIKNDFINNMGHELKTPLATVSAAIEAVQDYKLDAEKQTRYLGHARTEVKKLQQMIEDILDVSLQEAQQVQLNPVPIPVQSSIAAIIEQMRLSSGKTIYDEFQSDVGNDTVTADPVLFTRALTNVLDNAVKYAGEEVSIKVNCYADTSYFHIRISDNGEGIAADALPFILEKFYREPKTNHAVKGYGIGLSYVKEIMEAHKGTITVESIKTKGTTVTLSWPL